MSKTLLFERTKKIILFVTLLFGVAASGVFAQSLQPGDIAFTGFNGDGDDDFAIVTLKEISPDSVIFFTDQDWNGANFSGTGDTFSWSSGSEEIPAGTVITFNDISTGGRTVSEGTYTGGSAITLKVSNTVIFAYMGSEDNPSTFLASIATDTDQYDGTGGTLDGTGLDQGSTAVLLSTDIDVAEYVGDRSGNTPSGYLSKLNDISNWEEENGSGDQSQLILPFDDNNFTIVDPPIIAFTTAAVDSAEDSGTAELAVELVEANETAVDVEVAFLNSSSTATNGDDFANYSTQTVSFDDQSSSGDTQTISINLTDDGDFEGTERAVFQLQNITTGTSISPSELTLSISDDDAPDIVFNEINADPGDDANGDGDTDSDTDEFIEWVNNTNEDIDISGWEYQDSGSASFTFPEGTVIPAGQAVVLFDNTGDVQPQGNFGGAYIFTDSEVGLNNSSEQLSLLDADGNIIVTTTYDNNASGESNVLSPEITGTSYVDHSTVSGSGAKSSPGTKVDGSPFGSNHAIAIRGTEGWRMISSPVQNATFSDLFGEFWMQGVSGSDDPSGDGTLFSWTESGGGSFSPVSDMSDNLSPGAGYIAYFFEDDQFNTPGIQGGFPKIIDSDGTENSGSVSVTVSATDDGSNGIDGDEGFNLLGNPFDTDISVTEVRNVLKNAHNDLDTDIYVWDHDKGSGNGGYQTLDDGDLIAPFQAFFVRFNTAFSSTQVSFDKSSLEANEGKEFYKNVEEPITFDLELHGDQYFDTYSLEFIDDGTTELDRYDAYKLFSLNPNSINLYSTLNNNRLQKNVLPRELESNLEIPLSFDASGRTSLTFKWGSFENMPDDWDIILIDNEMNREINLRTGDEYEFTLSAEESEVDELANTSNKNSLLKIAEQEDGEPRFTLAVQPKLANSGDTEIPESVKLNPNYPNPFNPSTTLSFELAEDAEVTLSIWNMIGQKVATIVDGMIEAGTHQHTWNASNMPSGMYIARLEVGGEVFTRKMTLIK